MTSRACSSDMFSLAIRGCFVTLFLLSTNFTSRITHARARTPTTSTKSAWSRTPKCVNKVRGVVRPLKASHDTPPPTLQTPRLSYRPSTSPSSSRVAFSHLRPILETTCKRGREDRLFLYMMFVQDEFSRDRDISTLRGMAAERMAAA
jgi:hypothetical protein